MSGCPTHGPKRADRRRPSFAAMAARMGRGRQSEREKAGRARCASNSGRPAPPSGICAPRRASRRRRPPARRLRSVFSAAIRPAGPPPMMATRLADRLMGPSPSWQDAEGKKRNACGRNRDGENNRAPGHGTQIVSRRRGPLAGERVATAGKSRRRPFLDRRRQVYVSTRKIRYTQQLSQGFSTIPVGNCRAPGEKRQSR